MTHPALLNLPAIPLSARPKGCESCYFGGVKVGGRGPKDSPFVIVGESPGVQELHKGNPFVGPSGEMLEKTLQELGCTTTPLIINALQCFPRIKNPETMAQAVQHCQGRLLGEIQEYPRKVILALGGPASASLTGNPNIKITQVRGNIIPSPLSEEGIVLAVHPAFLMRNGSGHSEWKRDLKKAVNLLKGIRPDVWTPPTWSIIKTGPEYAGMVNQAICQPLIAGDIETWGFSYQKDAIISQGLTWDGRHVYIIPNKILWKYETTTRRLQEAKGPQWIWHNGKFDIKFFRGEGVRARVDHDTMLQSYALQETRGMHDLDQVAFRVLNAPNHKKALDSYLKAMKPGTKTYGRIPRDVLYEYQAYDIAKTFDIHQVQMEEIEGDANLRKLYHGLLIPASECLAEVEMEGLKLDPEMVALNKVKCEEDLKEPLAIIQGYALKYMGHEINVASWQQLDNLLYKHMRLGNPGSGTNADAIIQIQRKHNHPIVVPIQKVRKILKRKGTYVDPALDWCGPDGYVHCSYLIHGSTTGRLASRDPNMQNMERGPFIRRQFYVEDDEWLCEADLNQAELRSLAVMSADPVLLAIYRNNTTSIHKVTCLAFFGHDGSKDPSLSVEENSKRHDEYMRAKAVNFGIVYGRTAPSLAEEFDLPVEEAQRWIDTWFAQYPVAAEFIKKCRQYPLLKQTMITCFGRKKRWGVVGYENLHDLQNEAANYPHQSVASDITLKAAIIAQPILKERWNARICNLVHDAIYFKCARDPQIRDAAFTYLTGVMQQVPIDYGLTLVPFLADGKYGTRWDADAMKDWKPPTKAA